MIVADTSVWIDDISGGNAECRKLGIALTRPPAYKLDVNGTINTGGFRMPAGSVDGYALKGNANGVANRAEDQIKDADADAGNENLWRVVAPISMVPLKEGLMSMHPHVMPHWNV